ncbi:UDP-N-acetylmuramate:L-alanyl-gamma-D-glutamyl-meso-diaminopimelate ligase [Candidatus Methylospira mobilis]|uniref:UDP-N-acetylmuramate--L-alanyl-gamma-D-glutamyl-meso-2,6-diaminoheptandioate ligase n=1 Tax=Candidatus Methylospira mobilis TaxID=1808979 RepID=A0A5Q0BK53_9GAMM|nr:UDP-N-acetylmuramate:L-alanyl-gamma-D-glutamyl-meso-diaminopimelate ligase [Candidatus Methylospira mobilis]QFY42547.1 UDP-N-acetylmuramate:L-alanyl-gamma-D-glutamyl-meso-diaminopimelate ligase [Candidatus Methylospira mobilis]WNV04339.1 UDP-N-acetylmuramate:L-alanyl-gamma-D-glutamyl-meso-diaminopimelate ligase [Candidatus Methylospira mobilis]
MHIHIVGICGTFMGGLALIAREMGHKVTGSDHNIYPPMSTQLEEQGIGLFAEYAAANLDLKPDIVIIGNALSRGNVEVEAVLNRGLAYTSGARWLYEAVLKDRWVLAVSGTHGKTTTTSMLAWILEKNNTRPGFLIGGIPTNFGISARLGRTPFFVIEADEYDTAFFDKRSKFLHYRPRTLVINNLEYDHADIFPDLASIQRQFHHLVRMVPGNGSIVVPDCEEAIDDMLRMGCWTEIEKTAIATPVKDNGSAWTVRLNSADGSDFDVLRHGRFEGRVCWELTGRHNVMNAISAIAAASHAAIGVADSVAALCGFSGVKRRMEVRAQVAGVTLYDDFAHHPTAIATTLQGLRAKVGGHERIIVVLEPRSNTMRLGIHEKTLANSLASADYAIIYQPDNLGWNVAGLAEQAPNICVMDSIDGIVVHLAGEACRAGDHLVFMSNGGFAGIHGRVEAALRR